MKLLKGLKIFLPQTHTDGHRHLTSGHRCSKIDIASRWMVEKFRRWEIWIPNTHNQAPKTNLTPFRSKHFWVKKNGVRNALLIYGTVLQYHMLTVTWKSGRKKWRRQQPTHFGKNLNIMWICRLSTTTPKNKAPQWSKFYNCWRTWLERNRRNLVPESIYRSC